MQLAESIYEAAGALQRSDAITFYNSMLGGGDTADQQRAAAAAQQRRARGAATASQLPGMTAAGG